MGRQRVEESCIGARISHPRIHLYPGTYTPTTSPELAALLPSNTFFHPKPDDSAADSKNENPQIVFGNIFIQAFKGSSVALAASSPDIAKDWKIVVERLASVQWYQETAYRDVMGSINLGDNISVISGSTSTFTHLSNPLSASSSGDKWSSLLLPAGTYIQFPVLGSSLSSGSSAAPGSLLIRGSVPDRVALSRDVAIQGWSMDLSAKGWSLGSDACNPSCSPVGGLGLPTSSTGNLSTPTTFSCQCAKGFTGPTCSACEKGHYGPTCQPCSSQCFDERTGSAKCDDGITGSGGCRGVAGNSSASCNCLHGTCTSANSCSCSAGWADPTNATSDDAHCSVCREGWFLDLFTGDCLACPLGAKACTSEVQANKCIEGWSIDLAGKCSLSGNAASCVEGQYWDGNSCSACSPACQSCTGASSNECIKCASPRANILGSCVPYDATTGVCDLADVGVGGTYFVDVVKGRCDAALNRAARVITCLRRVRRLMGLVNPVTPPNVPSASPYPLSVLYVLIPATQDLGVCFQDDNDNGNTWWPWLLSVMLLLAIFGTVAWWVYRSRRQRRENTAAFAATLDDKEIDKRMAGLAGVFQILNPHKSHNRTPSRESFLPSNNARSTYREPQLPGLQEHNEYSSPYLVQPPAYQSSPNLTCIDVKEPTLPDALQAGPRRAPFKDRPTIADTVNAFDGGKRPFTNRIPSWEDSRDDGTDINEWLKDDDNGSIPLNDRNPFKIV
ncbi:hypothetical protein QFC20_000527 [Naganishia adeliensis]|uniref:Uncharacterized protein n=1 Tax=Naganishia adeliensis TaxID=92952 RepID=A0ACC2WZP2_9TREE|nr:hypothetical protein QFC20_000527 [Naganishia adeliensis]